MTLLTAENIAKRFGDQVILDSVSLTINDSDRIGLVGANGTGKTTLCDLLAGYSDPDHGSVSPARSCHIDYIVQDKTDLHDSILFDYVATARQDLLDLRTEIQSLEERLESNPDDQSSLKRLGVLQSQFETGGGFSFESEVKIILEGLGFPAERHSERLSNFSGGEKNRAGLGRALAGRGNLLILDEPTNHLDIESTAWLEQYISASDRACLIISHDRAFLQATVNQVWELQYTKLHTYKGSFSAYLKERQERNRLHEHHYMHQQQEIKRIEEYVRRNMAGQKTKQAQSKLKHLSRIKRIPPPRADQTGPNISMNSSRRSFAHVASAEKVRLGYGNNIVVKDVNFDLYRGDKVGLLGRNGSGKSTILKALIGELSPVEGTIWLGSNVDVAYFDQELTDLRLDVSVMDIIWELDLQADAGKIRTFLARFGFTGEDSIKKVSSLSGGERTKLSLAKLLYHPANLLILDEPTNHLDMDSREALEEALRDYDGSCLMVSHDRHFLDRVATRIFHVENARLKVYDADYAYFVEKTQPVAPPTKEKDNSSKEQYLSFKEKSRKRARHKKQIVATEEEIKQLEEQLHRLEREIDSEIPSTDWEKLAEANARKHDTETLLLQAYDELERLMEIELD